MYFKLFSPFDLSWTLKFIRSYTSDKYNNEFYLNSQLSICLLKIFFSLPC